MRFIFHFSPLLSNNLISLERQNVKLTYNEKKIHVIKKPQKNNTVYTPVMIMTMLFTIFSTERLNLCARVAQTGKHIFFPESGNVWETKLYKNIRREPFEQKLRRPN